MGKTNFDDLELGVAGIEAREINSESAAAGQVLRADGTGGAGWAAVASGFEAAYQAEIFHVEDASSVAWTDLGLAAVGVPAGAKAVALVVWVQDDAGGVEVVLRPNGTTWSGGTQTAPGVRTAAVGERAVATLIVPCGGGEVEYKIVTGGVGSDQAWVFMTLLGYWL